MTDTRLRLEINTLPRSMRGEVANFVAFLKSKVRKGSDIKSREFGYASGKMVISDDFDAPLDGFKAYM